MEPQLIAMLAQQVLGSINQGMAQQGAQHNARFMQDLGGAFLRKAMFDEDELGGPPKMEVPQSVDDYIGLQKTMARQEMPGASQMRQDIAETQASTLSAAKQAGQGADTMAAILSTGQDRMRALRQLGIAAAQYTAGQQQNYAQAVASRAPWEQQQFEYNQWLPWQMRKNEIMDMRNMGLQMQFQGMDMGTAAGIQGANMQNQNMWYMMNNPNYWNWMQGMGNQSQPNTIGPQMPWNTGRPSYSPPGAVPDTIDPSKIL